MDQQPLYSQKAEAGKVLMMVSQQLRSYKIIIERVLWLYVMGHRLYRGESRDPANQIISRKQAD